MTKLQDNVKFCPSCGKAMDTDTDVAENKTMTILAYIVGFTDL